MGETPTGWKLLHSQLPKKALSPLSDSVYGVKGLTDINEGYLIQRLHASGLMWDWRIEESRYLGSEERTSQGGRKYTAYLASVHGVLTVDGRQFHGVGAHDNKKLDAAYKGAATVAFKNATKTVGMWLELLLDGRAIDFIYDAPNTSAKSTFESTPPPGQSPEVADRYMVTRHSGEVLARRAGRPATEIPPWNERA